MNTTSSFELKLLCSAHFTIDHYAINNSSAVCQNKYKPCYKSTFWNHETSTNEMHTLQINALIRFLTSCKCFEPYGFIVRRTDYTRNFCIVCFYALM